MFKVSKYNNDINKIIIKFEIKNIIINLNKQ